MKIRYIKRAIILGIILSVCFLTGCRSDDISDQVSNVIQASDENILGVKNSCPNAYPDITWGEAFESFFSKPTWKYFVGTVEGADNDGDGKPDYTINNVETVEFTGYCFYQDVEVKALIQFTIDKENETFEVTYLSLNDVPQSDDMIYELVITVFNKKIEELSKIKGQEPVLDQAQNETQETKQQSSQYEEFLAIIGNYYEPPYWLDDEELDQYLYNEYLCWIRGEDYKNIIINNEGHLEYVDYMAKYEGKWQDTYSGCYMSIESYDGHSCEIRIEWRGGGSESVYWVLDGYYDEAYDKIHYTGSRYDRYYSDQYNYEDKLIYNNGEGELYFGADGMIHWDDWEEQAGEECNFERE